MACSVFSGSCSLCPWCGERHCPYFNDKVDDRRYWVYAVDRKGSYEVEQAGFKTKKEVVAYIRKLVNRKWAKKYQYSFTAKEKTAKGWKVETEYLPLIELTITDGGCNWSSDISLLINTEDKSIHYYNIWKTNFNHHPDMGKPRHIELIKEWDGKLKFINHKELPWYPTEWKK